MTPSLCSTPYLLCSFDPGLYPDMTTEFLSMCLYSCTSYNSHCPYAAVWTSSPY